MPTYDDLIELAEICLKQARAAKSRAVAAELRRMAKEYQKRAAEPDQAAVQPAPQISQAAYRHPSVSACWTGKTRGQVSTHFPPRSLRRRAARSPERLISRCSPRSSDSQYQPRPALSRQNILRIAGGVA
jgi:hypothetical protein